MFTDPFGLKAGCPPLCDNLDPSKDRFFLPESNSEKAGFAIAIVGAAALGTGVVAVVNAVTNWMAPAAVAAGAAPRIPFDKFQEWGRSAVQWGRGAQGAVERAAEVTAEQAAKLDPEKVRMARDFYQQAIEAGRGGAAAPERVRLMERILDLQK